MSLGKTFPVKIKEPKDAKIYRKIFKRVARVLSKKIDTELLNYHKKHNV